MRIYLVITWMLFIGIFPISFLWLKRAWTIMIKKDYSYVALKRGVMPENPEKFAPYSLAINLIAGVVLVIVIILVLTVGLNYDNWTAIAGTTIWVKFFAEFILSRHAHIQWNKGKKR